MKRRGEIRMEKGRTAAPSRTTKADTVGSAREERERNTVLPSGYDPAGAGLD